MKECKGEGSTSPTRTCQSGGVWGGGQCKEPGEPCREKRLIEPGVTVNMELKHSFAAVVV